MIIIIRLLNHWNNQYRILIRWKWLKLLLKVKFQIFADVQEYFFVFGGVGSMSKKFSAVKTKQPALRIQQPIFQGRRRYNSIQWLNRKIKRFGISVSEILVVLRTFMKMVFSIFSNEDIHLCLWTFDETVCFKFCPFFLSLKIILKGIA